MDKIFRKLLQIITLIGTNGYLKGFLDKSIYSGKFKNICVPGLNCYSCPGALGSCPIGSLQAVISDIKYKFSFYIVGFLMLMGVTMGRFICGWLCPFGLIQELLNKVPSPKFKVRKKFEKLKYLKYIILLIFVILLPMFWVNDMGMGSPTFCKYICPAGTLEAGIPLTLLNISLRSDVGFLFAWKVTLLIITIILSIFIFRYFLVFIIKVLKSRKNIYYKGSNLISISHIIFRIKSNSRNLFIIALLNAVTITAIGYGYSFYYIFEQADRLAAPFSYCYVSNDVTLDKKIADLITKYPENKLISSKEVKLVKVNPSLLDNSKEEKGVYLISQSQVEELAKFRNIKDSFKLVAPSEGMVLVFGGKSEDVVIGKITDTKLKDSIKVVDRKNYQPLNDFGSKMLVLMVQDEVYSKYNNENNITRIKGYIVENQRSSNALTKDIARIIPEDVWFNYETQNLGVQMFVDVICFIAIFIGLIFLCATGSVIYFKQLTESNDDKRGYEILKKIGVGTNEIKKSIYKQIFITFATPLFMGMFHSIVAFVLINNETYTDILLPATITIVVYVLIYIIYYFLTVKSYIKIID